MYFIAWLMAVIAYLPAVIAITIILVIYYCRKYL